jgi:hypothetical protein
MKKYRRQRQHYLFAGLLGVIGIINLLFFLILYRPVRAEYFHLQDSIQKTRAEGQARRLKIERLEKLNAQLETSAQDRQRLITMHFIRKDTGWSEILPLLEEKVQRAAVKNVRKDYTIGESAQYGLYSVKITLPVSGHYPNVVHLIKQIEDAERFFIIDSIDVRGGQTPGVQDVSMNLNLETFFYQ